MYILGVNISHDSSVCLLKDDDLRVALSLERITRVRRGLVPQSHFVAAMTDLIEYCLQCEGIRYNEVDYAIGSAASAATDEEERTILRRLGLRGPQILALPHPGHHLAHACAAFFGSGFDHACAVVIDAYGSPCGDHRESESAFKFASGDRPKLLFRNVHKQSQLAGAVKDGRLTVPSELSGVGEIYRVVTLLLGFRQGSSHYDDAGKTMGLASFGKRLSETPQLINIRATGLDFSNALPFLEGLNLIQRDGRHAYLVPRDPRSPLSNFHRDLAAQVQWEFEEAGLHLVRTALAASGEDTLVLGGGCFLNSVLNHRIARELRPKRLYIFPAATDDGNCYGAASYAYHMLTAPEIRKPLRAVRRLGLGRTYADEQIEAVLRAHALPFKRLSGDAEAAHLAAEKLAAGLIIGWFNGGGEFGPRALGHRSILANPAVPGIKDRLNARVKFRESFRPYGASVLLERVQDIFDLATVESPHMLMVCNVREPRDPRLQGITHVDGTCRIQTVGRDDDRTFHGLISAFATITGVPVILNTSFNLQGMPIVETPADALQCYLATQMDGLFLGRYQIEALAFERFVPVRRDLRVAAEGVWQAGQETFQVLEAGVQLRMSPEDTDATTQVSSRDLQLLQAIDGETSVGEIAQRLARERDELIGAILRLYRLRYVRWSH